MLLARFKEVAPLPWSQGGVVDEYIDPAKTRPGRFDHARAVLGAGDVGLGQQRLPPLLGDQGGGLLGRLGLGDEIDHDIVACRGQLYGDGASDSARGAGDEGNWAV